MSTLYSFLRCITYALILAAVSTSAHPAPSRSDAYARLLHRMHRLDSAPYSRLMRIGYSAKNRPIYAIFLTQPDNEQAIDARVRVMIMCGQHGDEPSSVWAMLQLADEMANTGNPYYRTLLKQAVLILVPVANPDGFASHRRLNALGADINRDWTNLRQPETVAISKLVVKTRPHVIVDQHEWTDADPSRPDCVEVAGFGGSRQYRLARLLAANATASMPADCPSLHPLHHRRHIDARLAHRHFAAEGTCSMLVETSRYWSTSARQQAYREFTMSLLSALVFPPTDRLSREIESAIDSQPKPSPMLARLYIPAESTDSNFFYWFALVLAAGFVLLRNIRGQTKHPAQNRYATSGRLSVYEAIQLSVSLQTKLAVLRANRRRPCDRGTAFDRARATARG
jgi:hypothetical protein